MPPGLTPEWQDWLAGQIVRGSPDPELLQTMRTQGFDEHYARVAISVVRSMTARVQQQAPAMLQQYDCPEIRIKDANKLRVADREVEVRMLLKNPNVAVLDGLLSDQECDKLVQIAAGKITRSEVIEPDGTRHASDVRTSMGTHFAHAENAVVDRIEHRLAALIDKPIDHGEPLQILHYKVGGEYKPHHDYFDPKGGSYTDVLKQGGQRIATLIFYLNEVEGGGETIFPELELAVKPRRGSGVYFEYCNQDSALDARLLHGGAPVTKGLKWIATKWIRQRSYLKP
jgi:prolyl 4-hydroxylase